MSHAHTAQATVKELEALRSKYGSLLTTAKSHEEMAGRAAREGQLRAEEVDPASTDVMEECVSW